MPRILTVLVGLVVFGTVLVAGPARAADSTPTQFQVAIVVGEGDLPAAGSTVGFDAVLTDESSAPVPGATVTLSVRPYGSPVFTPAAQTITGADGVAHLDVVLTYTSAVRWSYAGDGAHDPATSPAYTQAIAPRISARAVDSTLKRRQRLVVLGRTGPNKAGNRVSLWRGDKPGFAPGLEMTRIAVGEVRSDGTIRLTARFSRAGLKRLYVKVSAGKGNGVGYSKYLRVRVR